MLPSSAFGARRMRKPRRTLPNRTTRVLVGFRSAYVFDVSQTEGAELPELREIKGDAGENRDRLIAFIERQGIELVFTENIAPALGMSYGGRIAILPGQSKAEEFSHACSRVGSRDVTQGRAAHSDHENCPRNGGRGYRLCDWQGRRSRHRIPRPQTISSFITATHPCWRNRWKSSSRPPLSSLPHWSRPQPRR